MGVRGSRGSFKASATCFTSPFATLLDDFVSQNDFVDCSNDGVLSSSTEAMLGMLIALFLGVEHDG